MKFKDLPVKDKDILEGRKPLPEEAEYLMEKSKGDFSYIDPNVVDLKSINKGIAPAEKKIPLFEKMNQSELEARKWGRTLTDAFDVNPKTLEMTPKEGIPEEASKRYFDAIKRNMEVYAPTDNPLTNRIRGATSDNKNPDFSSLGLAYDSSTGDLIKKHGVRPSVSSLQNVSSKEEAVAEFQQLNPYYKLLQSVKEKYKNIQDPEERAKIENAILSEEINKNPQSKQQMGELKKNQQKVLDLYKEHIKKFGERV